ncbi:MAG: DUF945 domain-containing protein [Gammaproteobacteria bacterium]|nr:MAG: DUF945 domain-containing protein [Gammaproteobacteria bacterium]
MERERMSTKKLGVGEIIIWLVVVTLIVLIASPFALGFKVQSDYAKIVQNMAAVLQADIKIKQYERGMFTSDVVLSASAPSMPFTVEVKETIIHGPVYLGLLNQGKSPLVAAVVKGEMLPVEGYEAIYQKLFKGQPGIVYQQIINFSGDISFEEYVRPINAVIELEDGSPVEIQSSGITGQGLYSAASGKLTGEGSLPLIKITTDELVFDSRNINMTMSGNMGQNDLYIGDSVLSLGKLTIDSANDQFALHNLTVRSMTSEKNVLIDSQVQLNVQEVFAANERFGPVALNISVNGMNAPALKKLQAVQAQMQDKLQQGIPQEQVNAMIAGEMLALVPELLKQTQIKIEPLQVESELGKLQSSLKFSVDGLDQNSPADPLYMFTAMNLDFSLDIDEALMRQLIEWHLEVNAKQLQAAGNEKARKLEASVPMEQKVTENLQGMLDESWLTYNGSVYSSALSLHQGQMMLNGKQVDPLAQIMSQMSAQ